MKQDQVKISRGFAGLVILFAVVLSSRLAAQTMTNSGNPCATQAIDFYVNPGGTCSKVKVVSQSDWSFSPTPASVTYYNVTSGNATGYSHVRVVWNNTGTATARASYSCNNVPKDIPLTSSISLQSVVTPTVSLSLSSGSVCSGTQVTFTATGTNGGSSPTYQFAVDGTTVYTGSSSTYIYTASPGTHTVVAYLTSSLACVTNPSATPSTQSLTVYSTTAGGVLSSTNGNSFCGSGTINLSLSGYTGTPTGWYYQYNEGNGWSAPATFGTAGASANSLALATNGSTNRSYQFYVTVQSGVCAAANSSLLSAAAYTTNAGSVSPAQTQVYGVATGSLTVAGYAGTLQKWQQSADGTNWSDASPDANNTNTAPTYAYYNLTSSVYYRAQISNGACTNYSPTGSVLVYSSPVVQPVVAGITPALALGMSLGLQSSGSYYSYQWIKDLVDIAGATGSTYTATEPGQYQLRVKATATAPAATSGTYIIYPMGYQPDNTVNAVVTTQVRKAGVTPATNLYTLPPTDYAQRITYLDNLSRPVQDIAIGQSPLMKDVVQPYSYDTLQAVSWLPYTATAKSGLRRTNALANGTYAGSEQYLFYQGTSRVATSTAPFAKTVMESTPLGRMTEQGAAGTDWQPGSGHAAKPVSHINFPAMASSFPVRLWTTSGPSGYYAANTLWVNQLADENSNTVVTYTDKLGQTVLKRVKAGANSQDTTTWLETYYVYDTRGNLALQVPPKAVAKLNSGTAWSAAFRDQWCFVYTYDVRQRLVEKKTPDAQPIYYGYDPLDRLVLVQDGNLRLNKQWLFVKYDIKGRPVMNGIYTNTTYTTRPALQQNVLDGLYGSGVWYEDRGTALHGYTNQSFPTANSDASAVQVWTVNYYDTYDFDYNGTDDYSYTAQGIAGEGTQGNSFGLPTGSKRLILVQGSTNYLYAYQFYDRFGRVIQARTNNHLSLAVDNLTTVIYDFEGKALQTKTYHNAGGTNQATVVQKYTYDFAGRLTQVYHNINGAPTDQLVAQYSYNELGQMVDKQLHASAGSFLQSVDLRYNIRGWLTSINNAQLTADGVMNDDSNDYFGMELLYNTTEGALGNTASYNGNVSATKWKTLGETVATAGQRSYKYSYDKTDRLKTATFQAFDNTVGTWTKEANTLNEQITHDHNGNILSLLRNSATPTAARTAQTMDNLTYTYGYGNRLNKVADTGLPTAGFVDDNNAQAKEYTYDSLGNLLTDKNKNISAIIYNTLGKPQQITYTNGNTVAYTYDAAGSKLKVVSTVGGTATTTDYVGGFVYTNTALTFFSSPEGRVVKNGSNYEYQYAISDHQGNTRVLFTSAAPVTDTKTATFETAAQASEAPYFGTSYPSGSHINSTGLGPNGTNSLWLDGGYAGQVGLAKSYNVYPGDVVSISTLVNYLTPGNPNTNVIGLGAQLLSAFSLPQPAQGETGTAASALNAWGGQESGSCLECQYSQYPRLFVTILLFDKNYNLLDFAAQQYNGSSSLSASYTVKEEGFAYLYVSNENVSQVNAYFDNISVSYTPSRIIQSNEYYPFGLQTARSWARPGTNNNFLANGGTELNATTALYDLEFRNYDPALGRMHQVDPMADSYSSQTTYNYAFNSPVMMNDVNGADPLNPNQRTILSHWSADFAESYIGSDYGVAQRNARARANEAWAHPEAYANDLWDLVGGGGNNSYYFALAGAEWGEQNASRWLEKYAMDNNFSVHNDGTIYRYQEAGWVTDFVTPGRVVDENGNFVRMTEVTWSHMSYKEVPLGSTEPTSNTIGQPGAWESAIPVWGSGRAAVDDFQNGRYGWGMFNTAMAVSDVFLLKSIATGVAKGGLQLMTKNYKYWTSTRSFLGKSGFAETGQHVHHWALARDGAKKGDGIAWWFKNQMWNLKPVPKVEGMTYDAVHKAIEGKGLANWGIIQRLYYGTPSWPWTLSVSTGGRIIDQN